MNALRIGGGLVIAGSATLGIGASLSAAGMAKVLPATPGEIVVVVGLLMLGAGLGVVAQTTSHLFQGKWTHRGMVYLAAGIVLDALLVAAASTPSFSGSMVDVLIFPLIVAGWTTLIGFAITTICLLIASDRRRRAGATMAAGSLLVATAAEVDRLSHGAGLAVGIAALIAILAGIAGIGIVAATGAEPVPDVAST